MGTIRAVLTTHMPKQVWQSEDGNTFATEEECVAYEQVAPHLQALLEGLGEEAGNANRLRGISPNRLLPSWTAHGLSTELPDTCRCHARASESQLIEHLRGLQ